MSQNRELTLDTLNLEMFANHIVDRVIANIRNADAGRYHTKLTPTIIKTMRYLHKVEDWTINAISEYFGLSPSYTGKIVRGIMWEEIQTPDFMEYVPKKVERKVAGKK